MQVKDAQSKSSYAELAELLNQGARPEPRDVVLYGFGRIGRLLARLLIERGGSHADLRLRAIVVRGGRDGDLEKARQLITTRLYPWPI